MNDTASTPAKSAGASSGSAKKKTKPNIFQRIAIFWREVIAELRVSTRPSRQEWWALVVVVLVFLIVVMAYVGILDVVFAKVISWIFG